MNEVFIEVVLFASCIAGACFVKSVLLLDEIVDFMMESDRLFRLGGRL